MEELVISLYTFTACRSCRVEDDDTPQGPGVNDRNTTQSRKSRLSRMFLRHNGRIFFFSRTLFCLFCFFVSTFTTVPVILREKSDWKWRHIYTRRGCWNAAACKWKTKWSSKKRLVRRWKMAVLVAKSVLLLQWISSSSKGRSFRVHSRNWQRKW